jgi:hypothetical protein
MYVLAALFGTILGVILTLLLIVLMIRKEGKWSKADIFITICLLFAILYVFLGAWSYAGK